MTKDADSTQVEDKEKAKGKLAVIFAKINMSELPAMAGNVQELISLTYSSRSAAYDLSKVILKDYSLTNKVLQVVNSAYYSVGRSISSISKAVTILGFEAVRNVAAAIALFEDFINSGVEKEGISMLLTRSYLSALQARDISIAKNMNVLPEEAFICGLLHNLGKIITCIYLPSVYKEIESQVAQGIPEDKAARGLLDDLTYGQLGEEVGKFWNLSPKVIEAMCKKPEKPKSSYDDQGYLQNVANFTNSFVDAVCDGEDSRRLFEKYGDIVKVEQKEAVAMLTKSVEESEDLSGSLRYGLMKLNIRNKIENVGKPQARQKIAPKAMPGGPAVEYEEVRKKARDKVRMIYEQAGSGESAGMRQASLIEELDELPSTDKSINDFVRELTETMMGSFKLNDFYVNLLEALYRGVGFDRVILAIVSVKGSAMSVVGRYGLGEIDPANVAGFEHSLANPDQALTKSLTSCKDMAIPPNTTTAFPANLQYLVKDRTVYLLPICINQKAIGILYLDRKVGRPKLDQDQVKAAKLFRDFAVMAIQKLRKKQKKTGSR